MAEYHSLSAKQAAERISKKAKNRACPWCKWPCSSNGDLCRHKSRCPKWPTKASTHLQNNGVEHAPVDEANCVDDDSGIIPELDRMFGDGMQIKCNM